jgi:hypothetical protein
MVMQTGPKQSIRDLIQSLPGLPKERLFALWADTFGRLPGKMRPEVMLPVLAFTIQERAYGGLTTETKEQLRQIALTLSPKSRQQNEARARFKAGTRLIREWKGIRHEVTLTADGYEYKGEKYKSLSPIASKITGTHWSGPVFFGTNKKGTGK